jgi:hypothetical protein
MTIKQQGGIFGRNPTFNDVDVEGALSVTGVINSPIDIYEPFSSSDLGQIKDSLVLSGTEIGGINLSGGEGCAVLFKIPHGSNSSVEGARIAAPKASASDTNSRADLVFYTNNGTALSEAGRFNDTGNLAFPSGQGIDFSATSGTGTSELFSDYEEGSWSPTLTTDGTDFSSVTYDALTSGYYTKIGDLVVARGRLRTDAVTVGSASGNVLIGGLPFTVGGGATGRAPVLIGEAEDFSTNNPSGGRTVESSVTARLFYRSSANGAATSLPVSSIDTGANKNQASFTIIYRV